MVTGLGLFPLTFDWSQVAVQFKTLLLSPHWAAPERIPGVRRVLLGHHAGKHASTYEDLSLANMAWRRSTIQTLGLRPIFLSVPPLFYDRYGNAYNTTAVITDNEFDAAKYAEYSVPYLPATFAFVYGLAFASITRLANMSPHL